MSSSQQANIQIADKFQFLFRPKRIKVAFGGRGGAKTVSFSKAALVMAARDGKKFLGLREYMNSIEDSVHSSLAHEIDGMGLSGHFRVNARSIDFIGGEPAFRYGQLSRNLASIKSKHGYDVAWVEEAESISYKSLDTLVPTLRKSGSELWFSLNPADEFAAVYSEFIKPHLTDIERNGFYEDDELYVVKVGLEDNPFAPQELLDASESMRQKDYQKWLHVWGGACISDYDDSIIRPEWVEASIDAHLKLNLKAQGLKVVGFDPADVGDDKAVVMRHGIVVTHGFAWDDGEFPEALDKAFSFAYDNRADVVIYDGDGLGAGVKVGLDARIAGRQMDVQVYKGSNGVDDPDEFYGDDDTTNADMFRNKRAQYWWLLRDRFEATYNAVKKGIYTDPERMISLSSEIQHLKLLQAELVRPQRKRTNNSLIQLESKQDMRKRNLPSPNIADALVMAFANDIPIFAQSVKRPTKQRNWRTA